MVRPAAIDAVLMAQVQLAIQRQIDLLPENYSRDGVARLIVASIMHARCSVLETDLVTNERERLRFISNQRAVANAIVAEERMPL